MRKINKKPELLAPAGNLEKLKIAIIYGADAVFIGGNKYSLRSSASNFTIDNIKEAVAFASNYRAKIYVTVNMFLHNEDIDGLKEYLKELDQTGIVGIICADPIVIKYAKEVTKNLEIHISTQQSVTNAQSLKFFESQGVDRVVVARELSFDEVKKLKQTSQVELEYFIHGAMCVAYSGKCMLSNYFSRRDSNRGGCSQSCRWDYDLLENNDELTPISDESSHFTMSSKDLMLINEIPAIIEAGIDSLKIEGRMKSIHYIATIVSTYRKLIDRYCDDPDHFDLNDFYENEIAKATNRETSYGFYYDNINHTQQLYNREEHPTKEFIAYVLDDTKDGLVKVQQRNYFKKGDMIEFFGPKLDLMTMTVETIYDEDMNEIEVARHPLQVLYLKTDIELHKYDMARKVR